MNKGRVLHSTWWFAKILMFHVWWLVINQFQLFSHSWWGMFDTGFCKSPQLYKKFYRMLIIKIIIKTVFSCRHNLDQYIILSDCENRKVLIGDWYRVVSLHKIRLSLLGTWEVSDLLLPYVSLGFYPEKAIELLQRCWKYFIHRSMHRRRKL